MDRKRERGPKVEERKEEVRRGEEKGTQTEKEGRGSGIERGRRRGEERRSA